MVVIFFIGRVSLFVLYFDQFKESSALAFVVTLDSVYNNVSYIIDVEGYK